MSNKKGRMGLGYRILVYQSCRQARVEVSSQEDLLYPIKAIMVRKKRRNQEDQAQTNTGSGNECRSEEEEDEKQDHEPVPPFQGEPSSSQDSIAELTQRVDAF